MLPLQTGINYYRIFPHQIKLNLLFLRGTFFAILLGLLPTNMRHKTNENKINENKVNGSKTSSASHNVSGIRNWRAWMLFIYRTARYWPMPMLQRNRATWQRTNERMKTLFTVVHTLTTYRPCRGAPFPPTEPDSLCFVHRWHYKFLCLAVLVGFFFIFCASFK